MANTKGGKGSSTGGLTALKIGSRVRCTDDGVGGRIIWANAVSVKVRWDDGEQVTWRRDSLAGRPIEILAAADDEDQQAAPDTSEQMNPTAPSPEDPETAPPTAATEAVFPIPEQAAATELAPTEQPAKPLTAEPTESPEAVALEQTPAEGTQAERAPLSEPAQETPTPPEQTAGPQERPPAAAKPPRTRKPKQPAGDGKAKKLSALDAAAKVLGETGQAMTCQEMIAQMAAKGYWNSPKGQTPEATLYSAVLREIAAKGKDARFQKTERGKFARNGAA